MAHRPLVVVVVVLFWGGLPVIFFIFVVVFFVKVCILMLTIREPTFQVGDTFGIPVTLKDYGKEDTVEGIEKHHAYNTPFGRVTVLVCNHIFLYKIIL